MNFDLGQRLPDHLSSKIIEYRQRDRLPRLQTVLRIEFSRFRRSLTAVALTVHYGSLAEFKIDNSNVRDRPSTAFHEDSVIWASIDYDCSARYQKHVDCIHCGMATRESTVLALPHLDTLYHAHLLLQQ